MWPAGECITKSGHVSVPASSSTCSQCCGPGGPGENYTSSSTTSPPHRHPTVKAWAAANDVELEFLPTYGSWLNWIESEFAALRYFALNGPDHRSHAEQNAAIAAYVRWRNAHPEPKTNFAPDPPIRTWTEYPYYPAKVARRATS